MTAAQITENECRALLSNPGFVLRADAAVAWERATAAFGKKILITGSWRSYETQVQLFTQRFTKGDHRGQNGYQNVVYRWNGEPWTLKIGQASAAVPGTSNHGGGVAVDVRTSRNGVAEPYSAAVVFTGFGDSDRLKWLAVAAEYGWSDKEGKSINEPWHMTYYPENDKRGDKNGVGEFFSGSSDADSNISGNLPNNPENSKMTLLGFDISRYQNDGIEKVATQFAIHKISEGTSYAKSYIDIGTRRINAFLGRGIPAGAYHFSRADLNPGQNGARREAAYFAELVKPWIGKILLVLDHEAQSQAAGGATWAKWFLDEIVRLTGVTPLIYGSRGVICNPSYKDVAAKYPLWVARYENAKPIGFTSERSPGVVSPWPQATIFQYTSSGRLTGYTGDLDLNVFYGTAADWSRLAGAGQPAQAGAGQPALDPILKRGTQGVAVAEMQQWFKNNFPAYRFANGEMVVDGNFGPITEKWVREFQARTEINSDGIWDTATLAKAKNYGFGK